MSGDILKRQETGPRKLRDLLAEIDAADHEPLQRPANVEQVRPSGRSPDARASGPDLSAVTPIGLHVHTATTRPSSGAPSSEAQSFEAQSSEAPSQAARRAELDIEFDRYLQAMTNGQAAVAPSVRPSFIAAEMAPQPPPPWAQQGNGDEFPAYRGLYDGPETMRGPIDLPLALQRHDAPVARGFGRRHVVIMGGLLAVAVVTTAAAVSLQLGGAASVSHSLTPTRDASLVMRQSAPVEQQGATVPQQLPAAEPLARTLVAPPLVPALPLVPAPPLVPAIVEQLPPASRPAIVDARPAPDVVPTLRKGEDEDRARTYLLRGQQQLADGDVATARMFFKMAAEAGDPEAALAMGGSHDPNHLWQFGVRGMQPDVAAARHWYRRAVDLGSKDAMDRIEKLSGK
jgi:hypothetical protein